MNYEIGQSVTLTEDYTIKGKRKSLFFKAGDKYTIRHLHEEVLILESSDGERFPSKRENVKSL